MTPGFPASCCGARAPLIVSRGAAARYTSSDGQLWQEGGPSGADAVKRWQQLMLRKVEICNGSDAVCAARSGRARK